MVWWNWSRCDQYCRVQRRNGFARACGGVPAIVPPATARAELSQRDNCYLVVEILALRGFDGVVELVALRPVVPRSAAQLARGVWWGPGHHSARYYAGGVVAARQLLPGGRN